MVANAKGASASMSSMDSTVLVGMKEICAFLHRSEPTVMKLIEAHRDTIPIKKIAGIWESDRVLLNAWRQETLLAPQPKSAQPLPQEEANKKGESEEGDHEDSEQQAEGSPQETYTQ